MCLARAIKGNCYFCSFPFIYQIIPVKPSPPTRILHFHSDRSHKHLKYLHHSHLHLYPPLRLRAHWGDESFISLRWEIRDRVVCISIEQASDVRRKSGADCVGNKALSCPPPWHKSIIFRIDHVDRILHFEAQYSGCDVASALFPAFGRCQVFKAEDAAGADI